MTPIIKKLLVTTLLAIFSTGAMAEWNLLTKSDDSDIFLDPAFIKKQGSNVLAWDLQNYYTLQKRPDGKQYLSQVKKILYDCKNETQNILAIFYYTEQMGTGFITKYVEFNIISPSALPPNSVGLKVLKTACGSEKIPKWIASTEHETFTTYIDKTSINRKGKIASMRFLYDYKTIQNENVVSNNKNVDANFVNFLSFVLIEKFDCSKKMSTTYSMGVYPENMMRGKLAYYSIYEDKWEIIEAGSESDWKIACGKK